MNRIDPNLDNALLICTPDGIAVAPAILAKRCGRCRDVKSVAEFNREKRKRDGLSNWCKACKCADQGRRRREILALDVDWQIRKRTFAKLARLVAARAIAKPQACPECLKAVPARELQAKFLVAADPNSVVWRCRTCALAELGKSTKRICAWCDEPFVAQTHALRRGAGKYCSVRCRNAWMKNTAQHVRLADAEKRTKAEQVYLDDRF